MVETSQPITYSRLRSAAAPWKRPFRVVVFTFGLPYTLPPALPAVSSVFQVSRPVTVVSLGQALPGLSVFCTVWPASFTYSVGSVPKTPSRLPARSMCMFITSAVSRLS